MLCMRSTRWDKRESVAKTRLQERFLAQVGRLLYKFGTTDRQMTLNRDGLHIIHSDSILSVELDEEDILAYSSHHKSARWASPQRLRKAMKQMEAMFLLDELASI